MLPALSTAFLMLAPAQGALTPQPQRCRLQLGAHGLAPERVQAGVFEEHVCGRRRVRMQADSILLFDAAKPQEPIARLSGPEPELRWLAGDDRIAYFSGAESPKAQLLRLDLAAGAWLEAWRIDGSAAQSPSAVTGNLRVTHVLPTEQAVFVLRAEFSADSANPQLGGWTVLKLESATGKPLWSRHFAAGPATAVQRAFLLAPMRNVPARSQLCPLQRVGDGLLVCFGGESVMMLASQDGKTRWEVARPWEFERGFVGPSMWNHFMDRLGLEELDPRGMLDNPDSKAYFASAGAQLAARRAAFDTLHAGSIAAGPYLVRGAGSKTEPLRWLLVSSLAARGDFGEQRVQQFVHEFDADGRALSIVALPRNQIGSAIPVGPDRFAFACSNGAFACIGSSENGDPFGMGFPGSAPDCVGRLAWFLEPRRAPDSAWLACSMTADPLAVGAEQLVRLADGGRVLHQGVQEFQFPLWWLDAKDGAARELVLHVPFEGLLEKPTTNCTSDGTTTTVWGPLGIAVTRLEFVESRLDVTLAAESAAWTVSFETAALLR